MGTLAAMTTPDDTRTRLLLAAVSVIETEGEVGIRVRDVAAAAGVREPSIYHFFGSRDGLIEAAQEHRFDEAQRSIANRFDEAVRKCGTKDEVVQLVSDFVRLALRTGQGNRAVRISVLACAQTRPTLAARLAERQAESGQIMADALAFAQERGWIDAELDTLAFAAWLVGQTTGRVLIETAPDVVNADHWDAISLRAVFSVLGWDPPT